MDYNDYLDFSKGADLFVHDSEYNDEEYKLRKGWAIHRILMLWALHVMRVVKSFGLFLSQPGQTG